MNTELTEEALPVIDTDGIKNLYVGFDYFGTRPELDKLLDSLIADHVCVVNKTHPDWLTFPHFAVSVTFKTGDDLNSGMVILGECSWKK